MRKNKNKAVSVSLAFRFMAILAFAMLCLSFIFVFALRLLVINHHKSELETCVSHIVRTISLEGTQELPFVELPYYITYTVYESESENVLSTNDSLLPLLNSYGKTKTCFVKDFFTDSDLNIRYLTKETEISGKKIIVECALDISNDTATKMLKTLPYLALILLLPVLLVSFVLSYMISKSTISAFKKLQADYDREKEFTSNVSHELKTPIAIISGHANLLKRWGKNDPIQLEKSIDSILKESENMNHIVTTLLDMSRLERGKIEVVKTKFFATNFFAKLKEEFTSLYPQMKFEIIDEDFIELYTDEQKLHQIFTVILSNSVKFAGEKCRIILCAKRSTVKTGGVKSGGQIELSVQDNGTGFDEKILPHVFERFFKGDSSHDRNVIGSGLGLAIAKSLTESLGGSIKAKNAPQGGALISIAISN